MANFMQQVTKVDPFFFGGLFGTGEEEPNLIPPPEFYTDPNYQAEQDFLQPYGFGLLKGDNIPDFYKSIATPNSQEFQDVLNLSNRDIMQSAAETAARTGRGRGGSLPAVTAQAIGDNSAKLRYADFLSSNEGKKFLMQEGQSISEGVRSAGQNQGQIRNNFNLGVYDRQLANQIWGINREDAAAAQQGEALGKIAGVALPLIGGAMGGPTGAMAGSTLAGIFGGNQSSVMDLFKSSMSGATTSATTSSPLLSAAGVSDIGAVYNPSYAANFNDNNWDPQGAKYLFGIK